MAIQMRRGNAVDFNPAKMVPGEWAVSQDNQKLYMCFTQGNVIEIATASAIIYYVQDAEAWARGTRDGVDVDSSDPTYHNNSKYYAEVEAVEEVHNAEAWATGQRDGTDVPSTDPTYHNNSKYYAEVVAQEKVEDAEAWAVGQRDGTDVPSTDPTYENNSKYYADLSEDYYDYVHDAAEFYNPNFTIDWTTGELLYTGGYFTFWIDADGYIHWGVEHP